MLATPSSECSVAQHSSVHSGCKQNCHCNMQDSIVGVVWSVAFTTVATLRTEIQGIRPESGAAFSNPDRRSAKKRSRHNCTVGRKIASRATIC